MHRIRATLRHALNMAMRQDRLIDFNPAAVLEMPPTPGPSRWYGPKTASAPGRPTTAATGTEKSNAEADDGSTRSTPTPARHDRPQ